jgi:hypothetical protein
MSTAEYMRNKRRKIPVMVNGKSFEINGNELCKVNEILFFMNAEEMETLLEMFKTNNRTFRMNVELCEMNTENGENSEKTAFSGENPPRGGRGGFFSISTRNPNDTFDSTKVQLKEKNNKKRNRENHSEEVCKNFEIFWAAWPHSSRKTDKKGSLKRFAAAFRDNKDLSFETVMKGLEWWKNSNSWRDPQYIPAPEVWLHKCRWLAAENELSQPSEPQRAYSAPSPQPQDDAKRMNNKELAELFRTAGGAA